MAGRAKDLITPGEGGTIVKEMRGRRSTKPRVMRTNLNVAISSVSEAETLDGACWSFKEEGLKTVEKSENDD